LALALAALVSAPRAAHAFDLTLFGKPLQLNLTEYGSVAYHSGNGYLDSTGATPVPGTIDPGLGAIQAGVGSKYMDWLNRLQVDASWGSFTAMLRLDTDLFLNAPQVPPQSDLHYEFIKNALAHRYGNRLDVEKVAVGYTSRHLEVTLGDSYVTYGRGLVLALRKEDELGVDTTLRGISATVHAAGLNLNAVAGVTNILNVDTATGREADDPNDLVVGSRAEYRFGTWVVPGVDVALIRYAHNASILPQKTRDRVLAYSATLELPNLWNHGSVYLEYARQDRHLYDTDISPEPTAFYAAGTAYAGPFTLLLEFKNYQHYLPVRTSLDQSQVPELALTDFYNAPPTLERITQAVDDNTDVTGPHARLDVAITPNLVPFVSMAVFHNRTDHVNIYDPYAGVELKWQDGRSRLSVSGGRRISRYDDTSARRRGLLYQDTTHVEYDVNQWVTGPYSLELEGLDEHWHERYGTPVWHAGQAYLSLKRANLWSAALGYEYYTEFEGSIRSNYFNVNAAWNITRQVLVRVFAGGQRAGIKCVNGVCRNYPAFEGVRGEVIAKF